MGAEVAVLAELGSARRSRTGKRLIVGMDALMDFERIGSGETAFADSALEGSMARVKTVPYFSPV